MSGNNWPSSAHHRPVLRASGNRACNERLADINQSIHLAKISNAKSTLNTFGPSHKPLVNLKKKQQQYEQQNAIAYANGNLAEHLLDIYQRPAPFRDERPRTARPPPPPFTLNGRVRQQEREKVLATNAFMIRQLCSASSHYADIFSTSPSSPAARSSSRTLSSTRTPSHQSSARASASRPVSASVRSVKSPSSSSSSSSSSRSSSSAQQRSASAKRPPLIFDEKIFADQLALPVLSPPDPSSLPSSSSSSSSSLPPDSAHIAVAKVTIWRCARPVVYEIRVAGTEIVTCRTRISLQDLQTFFPEAKERDARVDCILSALQLVETPLDSSSSAVAHAPSSSLLSSSSSSSRSPVSVNAATSSSSSSAPRRRLMPVFRCGADSEPLMQGSGDRGGNDSGVSSPSAAAACVSPSSPAGGDPFADDNRDDNDDDDEDYADDCDDDNNTNNGSGGNDNNNAPGTAGDVVAQSAPSEYERPSTANGRVRVPASPDSDGFVDYDSAHFAFTDLDGDGGDGAGGGGDGDGDGASERVVESPPAQRRPSRPRVDIPPLELASVLTKS